MRLGSYGRRMRVVVLGAAGQTGRLVVGRLVAAGHDVLGSVRTATQAGSMHDAGASAVTADLSQLAPMELTTIMAESDAVVWSAGAGYGVDPEHLDGDACVAAQEQADLAGVGRWVQISSMYADRPEHGPPFLQAVLRAKARSDAAVQTSGLGWTIVRPGGLTNDVGTGQVELGGSLVGGTVPRADVAATVVACLHDPATARRAFDLVTGATPIEVALAAFAGE